MGMLLTRKELLHFRQQWRNKNQRVVFTNGCFDLLHPGHLDYLTKAKLLGDILIVGVNTDNSVRKIKDHRRPIVGEQDRAQMVAGLSPVDAVCLFDDDTPYELISALIPDVLVKGADWKIDEIVGKDIVQQAGGIVQTIEFLPGYSTSGIIDRIVKQYCPS